MSTFNTRVSTNDDNGYLWPPATWSNNNVDIGRTILDDPVHAAVRFQNVTIPQGATINSAKLTFQTWYQQTRDLVSKISGMDEDNTATLTSSPFSRDETTAKVDWNKSSTFEADTEYDSSDISSIVQEIVNRDGWSSGNAMGFFIKDDGSTDTDSQNHFYTYDGSSTRCTELTVDYTSPTTTSTSTTTSTTTTTTSTSTTTTSTSTTTTSTSSSTSTTTTLPPGFFGIKTSRKDQNVLKQTNPNWLGFSSDYNTLKYYTSGTLSLSGTYGPIETFTDKTWMTHDLGYYPFAVVYVKDNNMTYYQPLGRFQAGAGAYLQYYYWVTPTRLYVGVRGYFEEEDSFTATFKYKIFKNQVYL